MGFGAFKEFFMVWLLKGFVGVAPISLDSFLIIMP